MLRAMAEAPEIIDSRPQDIRLVPFGRLDGPRYELFVKETRSTTALILFKPV